MSAHDLGSDTLADLEQARLESETLRAFVVRVAAMSCPFTSPPCGKCAFCSARAVLAGLGGDAAAKSTLERARGGAVELEAQVDALVEFIRPIAGMGCLSVRASFNANTCGECQGCRASRLLAACEAVDKPGVVERLLTGIANARAMLTGAMYRGEITRELRDKVAAELAAACDGIPE